MDLNFQKTCFLSKNHQCLSLELTIRIVTAGLNNRLLGSQMFGEHPSCIFQLITGPAWLPATGKISVYCN